MSCLLLSVVSILWNSPLVFWREAQKETPKVAWIWFTLIQTFFKLRALGSTPHANLRVPPFLSFGGMLLLLHIWSWGEGKNYGGTCTRPVSLFHKVGMMWGNKEQPSNSLWIFYLPFLSDISNLGHSDITWLLNSLEARFHKLIWIITPLLCFYHAWIILLVSRLSTLPCICALTSSTWAEMAVWQFWAYTLKGLIYFYSLFGVSLCHKNNMSWLVNWPKETEMNVKQLIEREREIGSVLLMQSKEKVPIWDQPKWAEF